MHSKPSHGGRWLVRILMIASLSILLIPGLVSAQAPQPQSSVLLTVDTPADAAAVAGGRTLFIGGWAVDSASTGTGVERIEIYLDGPPGTGAWIGTARYGAARPDVAAGLGRSQWAASGFGLEWVPSGVAEGPHTLHVYAYSGGGAFASRTVNITVTGASARTCAPSPSCPYYTRVIGGWEIDTGGPSTRYERDVVDTPSER